MSGIATRAKGAHCVWCDCYSDDDCFEPLFCHNTVSFLLVSLSFILNFDFFVFVTPRARAPALLAESDRDRCQ
jgi:hypothetical protein